MQHVTIVKGCIRHEFGRKSFLSRQSRTHLQIPPEPVSISPPQLPTSSPHRPAGSGSLLPDRMQQRHDIPSHHPLSTHPQNATRYQNGTGIPSPLLPCLTRGGDIPDSDADGVTRKEEGVFRWIGTDRVDFHVACGGNEARRRRRWVSRRRERGGERIAEGETMYQQQGE